MVKYLKNYIYIKNNIYNNIYILLNVRTKIFKIQAKVS